MNYRFLSSPGSNPKTAKSAAMGYYNGILHLAPAEIAGVGNLCPAATQDCKDICLHLGGRAGMKERWCGTNSINRARIHKARTFVMDTEYFLQELDLDIEILKRSAIAEGLKPCIRLNGTSDIPFEYYKFKDTEGRAHKSIIHKHRDIKFYDYTKIMLRFHGRQKKPQNLHLTLSFSGNNGKQCIERLKKRGNVAVIFKGPFPDRYFGYKVIDGDEHDLRFLDKRGVVVGLKAKGLARTVESKAVICT